MNVISKKLTFEAQEKSPNGDYWFVLGSFEHVDEAKKCLNEHFVRWYGKVFDSIDDVDSLRIVARSEIEVVL